MSRGIELLKDISQDLPVSDRNTPLSMPQGKLRFLLEYRAAPDLDREKQRLSLLLQTEHYELFPLPGDTADPVIDEDDEFGFFLVLQFPALDRTLSQRSLFDIGYALEDELELLSAEPDLAEVNYQDPEPTPPDAGEQPEGAARDAFNASCWVDRAAPANKRWALDAMRIPQAWSLSGKRGEGIVIAQPDTGVAAHSALTDANLRLDLGINFAEGNDDPSDPLDESATNPGHGTATSSVITCPENSVINGAAPGAELIPIRCVNDVKIFDAAPVIAAINHARQVGSHVITMSLGGTPSRAMKKSIKAAIANDIIVVTAAGNCVKLVVWPARYSAVIGIGGSNIDSVPWKGTSRGSDVDISAPAELVWVARRKPGDNRSDHVEGAQGTSYATALTAGTAALWLAHHGREKLISIAAEAGISLQSLFRHALQSSAQQPDGWETADHGVGIVNAEALLQLAPEDILQHSAPDKPNETDTNRSNEDLLLARLDGALVDSSNSTEGIRVQRFEREIGAVVLESARSGASDSTAGGQESVAVNQELSATLSQALDSSTDELLASLGNRPVTPPAALISQAIETADARTLTSRMSMNRSGLESTSGSGSGVSLDALGIKKQLDMLEKRIDNSPLAADCSKTSRDTLKQEVLGDTEEVLEKLQSGKLVVSSDIRGNTALEALVRMQGRPVIRLDETPIDIDDPGVEEWVGKLAMVQFDLPRLALSIGRIDADNRHQGTGFVVGPGLVMTNRHVIEGFAAPLPSANRPERWLLERHATINFSPQGNDLTQQFVIKDVLFTGPDKIMGDPGINHDELDLALVAVEKTNATGTELPAALGMGQSAHQSALNKIVFLIGYPAAPASFPKDENGRFRRDVVERIRQLFGMDFGRCYLSPGLVELPVSQFTHGIRPISFTHDATSLGGSSGSCLLSFGSAMDVVGLHYGGDWLRANFAHDLAHVSKELIRLPALFDRISSTESPDRATVDEAVTKSKVSESVNLSAPGKVVPT